MIEWSWLLARVGAAVLLGVLLALALGFALAVALEFAWRRTRV